jgi:RNA polymerase sigma-70 factor (ECF subfamily)
LMDTTGQLQKDKAEAAENERLLIARAQTGDLDAFDQLVRRYETQVFNLAYRLTENYDDASDIASEAFVRVFAAIKKFRGDSAFSTWLYRIVTNAFLDERKRRKARPQVSLEEELNVEGGTLRRQVEDTAPGPTEHAELEERRRVLDSAIQELPDFQRQIVVMFHVLNMSYEEICDVTGLPIGTVKSRLNRARLALRDQLEQHWDLFHQ